VLPILGQQPIGVLRNRPGEVRDNATETRFDRDRFVNLHGKKMGG